MDRYGPSEFQEISEKTSSPKPLIAFQTILIWLNYILHIRQHHRKSFNLACGLGLVAFVGEKLVHTSFSLLPFAISSCPSDGLEGEEGKLFWRQNNVNVNKYLYKTENDLRKKPANQNINGPWAGLTKLPLLSVCVLALVWPGHEKSEILPVRRMMLKYVDGSRLQTFQLWSISFIVFVVIIFYLCFCLTLWRLSIFLSEEKV